MRSIIKENATKETAAVVLLAELLNQHINNPEAPVVIDKKLSKKLGYSLAKLDCAIWAIEGVILDLMYGSYCESEEEEEYGKLKDRKEGGND
jgi:hypothetical protein